MRSDLMLNYFKSFKTYDLSFSLSLLPLANEHLTTKFMCVCVLLCIQKSFRKNPMFLHYNKGLKNLCNFNHMFFLLLNFENLAFQRTPKHENSGK
jgi:hypothetical protein